MSLFVSRFQLAVKKSRAEAAAERNAAVARKMSRGEGKGPSSRRAGPVPCRVAGSTFTCHARGAAVKSFFLSWFQGALPAGCYRSGRHFPPPCCCNTRQAQGSKMWQRSLLPACSRRVQAAPTGESKQDRRNHLLLPRPALHSLRQRTLRECCRYRLCLAAGTVLLETAQMLAS